MFCISLATASVTYFLIQFASSFGGVYWWGPNAIGGRCVYHALSSVNGASNGCEFFNYDEMFEGSGLFSFVAFTLWRYRGRFIVAVAQSLFFFGSVIAVVTYLTNDALWQFTGPTGDGLPWWTEQVTYQSCLIRASSYSISPWSPNCTLFNYADLFVVSIVLALSGGVVWRYYRVGSETRRSEINLVVVKIENDREIQHAKQAVERSGN